MGLRRSGMVAKTSGTTTLSLAAGANESFRVRELHYFPATAAAEDVDVSVDRKRILQFKAPSAWRLLGSLHDTGYASIVHELIMRGLFPTIPVASGETFEVSGGAASSYMEAVYDLYDADDVRAHEPNGSKSKAYRLFQVISNVAAVTAAGDVALGQSDLDSVFPAFPGGAVVPANTRMKLLALFGSGAEHGDGSDPEGHTTYLRLLKDREDILDQSLTGMSLVGDTTVTADALTYSSKASRLACGQQYVPPRIITFEDPPVFDEGTELNATITVAAGAGGTNFEAAGLKLGLIFDVEQG